MVNSFRARWGSIAKRSLLALIVALAFGLASCSAPGGAIVDPTDTVRTAIAIGQTQTYRTDLPGDGCDIHAVSGQAVSIPPPPVHRREQ